MQQETIVELVSETKAKIRRLIVLKQYDDALELTAQCALLLYATNMYYVDDELEEFIRVVADVVFSQRIRRVHHGRLRQDTVLFYDGFGMDNRGLARIYIDALVRYFKVCYVTYADRANEVPEILRLVHESGGMTSFIQRDHPVGMIHQLNEILCEAGAEKFIFYSQPNDVVAVTLMYAYSGMLTRYQVNLTDHAFWLGARAIDKCIEFRDYGASITNEYRGVSKEKIVKLPFYPAINKEREFQGYPFPLKDGQKVVFSGGALYKTLGEGNKYYEIVDYILDKHENVIFWYAGSGDASELKKCMIRHPGRVFHTQERTDLFQVLQHSCFYLSTYPIAGGLMYQYAAAAGVVPVTLRRDDDNDGFLLNQDSLNVDFDTMDTLKMEIDRLLTDESYRQAQGRRMEEAVISADVFSSQLRSIMISGKSTEEITYRHMDTGNFRRNYLETFTERDLVLLFARKERLLTMLRFFPIFTVKGAFIKILLKLEGK